MTPSSRDTDSFKILVVDDDRDTAESMAFVLRHLGHAVVTATDGFQAIELARRQRPTHVLLDLAMPRMDGLEVATRLRRELPGPFVLIAITGLGQAADRQRTRAAGFDHHLLKPADLDELLSLLAAKEGGIRVRQAEPGAVPGHSADEGGIASVSPSNRPGTGPIGSAILPYAGPVAHEMN
jgi:CheY-like chemotaxis protein